MEYFAKPKGLDGKQVTVKEHIDNVANLAEKYGKEFECGDKARMAGQMHDFGKYSEKFQKILTGHETKVDHAICGSAILWHAIKQNNKLLKRYRPILEAISGHHDGLLEFDQLQNYLKHNLEKNESIDCKSGKKSALSGENEYKEAREVFMNDHPDFQLFQFRKSYNPCLDNIIKMLHTRMIFSCLVDADYSVSAMDNNPHYLEESEINDFDADRVLKSLYRFRDEIKKRSNSDSKINEIRNEVFDMCGNAGESDEGLFTLTSPTGTGKTLALLHFALRHCIHTGKKRIIIVLPFLTLTEQNVAIYKEIYPQVLESHSQSHLSDEQREYADRWSAPIIITTSVQFFETLFAYRPTDCRKLHNIANSVVIFDEAQSLPIGLIPSTIKTVNELTEHYHTTMLFSTATQPNYEMIRNLTWNPSEIITDKNRIYKELKRINVDWRMDYRTSLEDIAEEMASERNACVIVNLRSHARKLYTSLVEKCGEEEVFFMTTDLCADHRKVIVDAVNKQLHDGGPCKLVATQCIEAGVDFDFDVMYRALAPLESIVQAAGRCNRNGKIAAGGKVVVFVPDESEPLYPGGKGNNWYEIASQYVQLLHAKHEIDINNPEHLKEYYSMLYNTTSDNPIEKRALKKAIDSYDYEETDKEYKLIEDNGFRLIVPFERRPKIADVCKDKKLRNYKCIHDEAVNNGITKQLIKESAGLTVSVGYAKEKELQKYAEVLIDRRTRHVSNFYVLRPQYYDLYSINMGLQFPNEEIVDNNLFII